MMGEPRRTIHTMHRLAFAQGRSGVTLACVQASRLALEFLLLARLQPRRGQRLSRALPANAELCRRDE